MRFIQSIAVMRRPPSQNLGNVSKVEYKYKVFIDFDIKFKNWMILSCLGWSEFDVISLDWGSQTRKSLDVNLVELVVKLDN